jgi:tRNA threonylcarbamoyladenosine biosynthesis protein TsaE
MIIPTVEAMEALGMSLAIRLKPGDIIALTGGLGAGKTTLARGILRGLGYDEEVPSPSFAIVKAYEPPAVRLPLAHVDLYRLERAEEAAELGLEDWLDDGALVV